MQSNHLFNPTKPGQVCCKPLPWVPPTLGRGSKLSIQIFILWSVSAKLHFKRNHHIQANTTNKPPIINIPPIYSQANTTESTHQGFTTTTHQGWPTGEFYMNRKSFLWYTCEFYMKRINVFLMMPMPSISDLIRQSATSCTSCGTLSGRWTTRSTQRTASCPPPLCRCGQTLPSKALLTVRMLRLQIVMVMVIVPTLDVTTQSQLSQERTVVSHNLWP